MRGNKSKKTANKAVALKININCGQCISTKTSRVASRRLWRQASPLLNRIAILL
jgi:hypothetical protein